MCKLQAVQNASLFFAHGKNWSQHPKAKDLHEGDFPILPVNQTLYWRAKKIWDNISTGQARNIDTYQHLVGMIMDENKYKGPFKFPSSLKEASAPEPPPPIYQQNNKDNEIEGNWVLEHIRNIINTNYLTADRN